MSHFLLVTLCNNPLNSSAQTICLEIPADFNCAQIKSAPIYSGFDKLINSITGISQDSKYLYLLSPGQTTQLSILDKQTLSSVSCQELPEVHDAHSILAYNGKLYVVSTGTDEIITYDIKDQSAINPKIFWKIESSNKDTNHINSINNIKGDFYITAFGPKAAKLHSSARNGYILNISKGTKIKKNIYHPHTLSVRNGTMYYCESSRKYFCSLTEDLLALNGYARGIAWINDHIVCVATSVGRTVSKSTGQILNPADPGTPSGACEITIYNIVEKKILAKIDLSEFGPEIYDLLLLDSKINLLEKATEAILTERKQHKQYLDSELSIQDLKNQELNSQLSAKENSIDLFRSKLSEREAIIQNLTDQINTFQDNIDFYSKSRSWRLTAPFRALMNNFRKNGSKPRGSKDE